MVKHIYVSAYGKQGIDQGIIDLTFDENKVTKTWIRVDGKSNLVIEADDQLITSVQESTGNYLLFFNKDGVLLERIQTIYFYSFGELSQGHLLLASFEEGVDSSYNLQTRVWTTHGHQRTGFEGKGRSHFIKRFNGKIISVDNATQQIYVYEDETLQKVTVTDFELGLNIRLLSYDETGGLLFLNTELTNELLVLQVSDLKIIQRIKITENRSCFSGGNAYDPKRALICISMRCENSIYLFRNDQQISLVHKLQTKKMPRDLKVIGDHLYVTCVDDNCIEVFDLESYQKINEIDVFQPVTFSQ